MKPSGLPKLEGWTALPDAAEMMGITRQRAHQMLPSFTTARNVGTIIVVRTAEVRRLMRERSEATSVKAPVTENAA